MAIVVGHGAGPCPAMKHWVLLIAWPALVPSVQPPALIVPLSVSLVELAIAELVRVTAGGEAVAAAGRIKATPIIVPTSHAQSAEDRGSWPASTSAVCDRTRGVRTRGVPLDFPL